jgi:tetratricopeptide (TPR) repeat protein
MSDAGEAASADFLSSGLAHYQRADFVAAAEIFASMLHVGPDDEDALRLRGLSLLRAGLHADALQCLARAVAVAPQSALAHLHHGVALLELGCCVRAAARLRRAVTLDPASPAGWINFSSALLAIGQNEAARAAARRALALSPGDPDALHALARGHAALGDLEPARLTFVTLLQRDPNRLDAWIDLGLVHARAGNLRWAREAMQRAVDLNPRDGRAAANLAAFGLVTGGVTESLQALRDILARDPGCVPAQLNLANALLLEREPQEALEVLAGPPPPEREGRHWLAHRALALMLTGQARAAAAALDAIQPPYGDAGILVINRRMHLAQLTGDAAAREDFAAQLAALVEDDAASLFEHRVVAAFDLARLRLHLGDRAAAFGHWRDGHRLMQRAQPFSRDQVLDFFQASVEVFDAAGLHRLSSGAADPAPVFIIGLPRSGTTLTEQVLAAHAEIHGAGERKAIHELISRLTGSPLHASSVVKLGALDAAAMTREAAAYLAELHEEAPAARYVVDKMPGNAVHLGFIAALLPGAKFILTRRDLRDTGLSIFEHRFFGYHPYAHDLADLGFYMRAHDGLMAHWRGLLGDRLVEVALSDWVEDFAGTLRRLEAFLHVPHDPACFAFHESRRRVRTASAAQVRQPINRRGIDRWQAFAAQLGPMIAELERPTA